MSLTVQDLSYIFSVISLVFYSIVYVPQFYVIYKSKSSSGISFWMLLLWTQADILSLIGTIVLYMHVSIVLIGYYHYTIGAIMILFVLYYKEKYIVSDSMIYERKFTRKFLVQLVATVLFLAINTFVCLVLNFTITESHDVVGECLGWITMSFYLIGRFPQMWLNYKRKSTEGLSLLMYLFTMLGNGFYILVITIDPETIQANVPWIVTGVTTIFLDIVVIGQHFYYKSNENIQNDEMSCSSLNLNEMI
jgi:uncharacterized protein with PQ loop repeat